MGYERGQAVSANEASVCTQEASTVPPMGNCGWTCRGEAGRGSQSLPSLRGTLPICRWGAGSGKVGGWGRELAARVVLGQLPQSIRLGPHQSSSPSWVLTELPPGQLKKVVEVRAGSSTSSFYCRERRRVRGGQHKGRAAGAGVPSAFRGLKGRLGAFGEWQERCRETRLSD